MISPAPPKTSVTPFEIDPAIAMHAMILAAGRGERMRPLTDHTPKPLLTIVGKPLIVWIIERLVRGGLTELVINHAHLGAQIEAALGDGRAWGANIQYSPEGVALETAGGIAQALPLLGAAPFIAVNGDVWCDFDFAPLVAFAQHRLAAATLAHLVLIDNPEHNLSGDFTLSSTGAIGNEPATRLTFAGIGVYRPALFAGVSRGAKAALAPLLRAAATRHEASGERFAGDWVDVGTPARLAALDHRVRLTRA